MKSDVAEERSFQKWAAPRKHGMATGLGLVLLGAWGALIPFIGPSFDYAYSPNHTWMWTAGRGYLEVLPGVVAFLAGIVLLRTAHRVTGSFAAWLAVAAGAWFVVGPLLAPIWDRGAVGTPLGNTTRVSLEQIGFFYGVGAAIVLCGAVAIGRFSVSPVPATAAATSTEPVADPMARPAAQAPVETQVPVETQAGLATGERPGAMHQPPPYAPPVSQPAASTPSGEYAPAQYAPVQNAPGQTPVGPGSRHGQPSQRRSWWPRRNRDVATR